MKQTLGFALLIIAIVGIVVCVAVLIYLNMNKEKKEQQILRAVHTKYRLKNGG